MILTLDIANFDCVKTQSTLQSPFVVVICHFDEWYRGFENHSTGERRGPEPGREVGPPAL